MPNVSMTSAELDAIARLKSQRDQLTRSKAGFTGQAETLKGFFELSIGTTRIGVSSAAAKRALIQVVEVELADIESRMAALGFHLVD